MRFGNVCIEALSHVLPDNVVTSAEIESWLKPLYDRFRLAEGRLELMTGIRERRFWAEGVRPSEAAARAGRMALETAGVAAERVGCLLNCSVSRDALEPATSTEVHRLLRLPDTALNFDISNACLGVLSGMLVVAGMIELGQIEYGLVVASENSRPLVESTVRTLNEDENITRRTLKPHFSSLSIGSAAAGVLLTKREFSKTDVRLLGGANRSHTSHNHLCRGGTGSAGPQGELLMATDSSELLERGIDVARYTWAEMLEELHWQADTPELVCTHQVGRVHSQRLFEALGLRPDHNFVTFPYLGNCGSASLPATASMAAAAGRLEGRKTALLGIGSGINCTMLGIDATGVT